MAADDADEDLTHLAIGQALREDYQYHETVDIVDELRIAQIRRLGRTIGREHGWKIRTLTAPAGHRLVDVYVIVTEGDILDPRRLEEKKRAAIRAAAPSSQSSPRHLRVVD